MFESKPLRKLRKQFLGLLTTPGIRLAGKEDLYEREVCVVQLSHAGAESASRVIFMRALANSVKTEVWDKLYSALSKNCFVVIEYKAEGPEELEKYAVKPYQLIFDNGA